MYTSRPKVKTVVIGTITSGINKSELFYIFLQVYELPTLRYNSRIYHGTHLRLWHLHLYLPPGSSHIRQCRVSKSCMIIYVFSFFYGEQYSHARLMYIILVSLVVQFPMFIENQLLYAFSETVSVW